MAVADENVDSPYGYLFTPQALERRKQEQFRQENEQGGRGIDQRIMPGSPAPGHFRSATPVKIAQMGNNLDALTGNPSITDMAGGGGVQDEHVDLIADTLRKHGIMVPEDPSGAASLRRALGEIIPALGKAIAPNITSLASGEPRPPIQDIQGAPPGKVPGTQDPRIGGAMMEALPIAAGGIEALGARAAAPAVAAGARMAETGLARMGAEPAAAAGAREIATGRGMVGRAIGAGAPEMQPTPAGAETVSERKSRLKREEEAATAEQQRKTGEAEAEQRRKDVEAQATQARETAAQQSRLQEEAKAAEVKRQHEEEQRQADMALRDKHPTLAATLAGVGVGTSFGLPYLTRVLNTRSANKFVKELQSMAAETNKALMDGDVKKAGPLVNQLIAKEKQIQEAVQKTQTAKNEMKELSSALRDAVNNGDQKTISSVLRKINTVKDRHEKASEILPKALVASSMFAPIEIGAAPEEYDIMFGTPKAKERAKSELMPTENPLRLPFAALQGVSLGSIGAEAPVQRKLAVPTGVGAAAKKSLKELRASDTRAITRAAKQKETQDETAKARKIYGVGSAQQGQFNP